MNSPLVQTILGTAFSFLITFLGACSVFFFKKLSDKTISVLYSLSAGVMVASSIFSLIIPAIDFSNELNLPGFIVLPVCFILGSLILIFTDIFLSKKLSKTENFTSRKKNILLISSITLHNIPEGMCIGVAFAGAAAGLGTTMGAVMLAVGIAIQNFPEGAAVAFPLFASGKSRLKSCIFGGLSGIVEFIFGVLACLLASQIKMLLPFMLALAAGMMMIVAMVELIPEACQKNKLLCIIGLTIGFIVMMALDLALG